MGEERIIYPHSANITTFEHNPARFQTYKYLHEILPVQMGMQEVFNSSQLKEKPKKPQPQPRF